MRKIEISIYSYSDLSTEIQNEIYSFYAHCREVSFFENNFPVILEKFGLSNEQVLIEEGEITITHNNEDLCSEFVNVLEKEYDVYMQEDLIMSSIEECLFFENGKPIEEFMYKL